MTWKRNWNLLKIHRVQPFRRCWSLSAPELGEKTGLLAAEVSEEERSIRLNWTKRYLLKWKGSGCQTITKLFFFKEGPPVTTAEAPPSHGCTLPPLFEITSSPEEKLGWLERRAGHSLNPHVTPAGHTLVRRRGIWTNSDNLLALPFHLNLLAGHTFQNDFVMEHKFLEKDFTMRGLLPYKTPRPGKPVKTFKL